MSFGVERNKGQSLIEFPDEYCVIDIETTGYDPYVDEIIELAATHIKNNTIVDTFQSLIKPSKKIDKYIEELTGITNSMVATAPLLQNVLPDFLNFVSSYIIVGHNVNFDINFIYDYSVDLLGVKFQNNYVDTLRLARKLFPELEHHRLIDLVDYFKFPEERMHRALVDCKYTFLSFEAMRKTVASKFDSLESFVKTFRQKKSTWESVKAKDIVPTVQNFDSSNPFYNKVCVFTGTLKFSRAHAILLIKNLGGIVKDGITKETNFLIVGDYSQIYSVKGEKTTKILKAEAYRLQGCDIQILSENTFYDLLQECEA